MTFGCLLGLTRLLLCGLLMPRVIVVQDQPPPPPPANPGFAACSYSGGCGETTNPPGLQALPVEQLPPECTSLFFDGLRVNKTFSIGPARGDSDNGTTAAREAVKIERFGARGTSTFVPIYRHTPAAAI